MLVLFASVEVAAGQVVASSQRAAEPPAYQTLRYDEDYLYLRDSNKRSDP